jgi:tyrosyl-tRNA synthetase
MQVALTVPLLVGLDGVKKMSKSYGNFIAFNDAPNDLFGKTMRLSDELMYQYYELLTSEDMAAVKAKHPMQAKKELARLLTARFHGDPAANDAFKYFDETFSQKKAIVIPDENAVRQSSGTALSKIIVAIGGTKSLGEARRLMIQGAVSVNEKKVTADTAELPKEFTLKVGKHQFFKVILS